jgi:voltage-gated potassium channel
MPLEEYEIYILSIYFMMTTISTIGYGDIVGTTALQRVYVIILMIFGVIFFTLLSGAIASYLTAIDQQ